MAPVWVDVGQKKQKDDTGQGDHAPCTFAGSALPMLSGAPPQLLATAILYIEAQAFQPDQPLPIIPSGYLRPPLRGPPSV